MDLILGAGDELQKYDLGNTKNLLNHWAVKIKVDKEFWGW